MKKSKKSNADVRPLQKLSLFFFNRPRKTALLCLAVVVFGVFSYTTLLKREGFPAIETPFAISQGTYIVNDASKVDEQAAKPLSDFLLKQEGVKSVVTQSFDNFFTTIVNYESDVNATERSAEIQKSITESKVLPEQANNKLEAFKFGFTQRGDDFVVSFYSEKTTNYDILVGKAAEAADYLRSKNIPLVESVSIINPYEKAKNPITGEESVAQKTFERFGKREGDSNNFHDAVVIGFMAKDGADILELDKQIRSSLEDLKNNPSFADYKAEVSASNAPQINAQIDELQKTLIEGLIAVLIVGSIVIAVRASLMTVLSMVTVLAITNALLYLIGYSLNTITLFALILGLSLIVDDTIIMVEAIDAQRKKRKNPEEVVSVATRKVSRAMVAATSTAALSFAPLIFVGGILGGFIRAIPVTIISALIISLIVALIFIPLFARFLLLGKKQMGEKNVKEVSAGIEAKIAAIISWPMLWAKHSRVKLASVSIAAVFIGLSFIGFGGYLFGKVGFNIFPPTNDSNYLSMTITYPPGTNIDGARQIAADAEQILDKVVESNFDIAAYYGQADVQLATMTIVLTDYKDRDVTSPELVDKLKKEFETFTQARVNIGQLDAGPPAAPFKTRVASDENREAAIKLATDISSFLKTAELKRIDGSTAQIENVSPPNTSIYTRSDAKAYIVTEANFKDSDTSTLVTLAQDAIKKEFPKERLATYGLKEDAISFDLGQESENQDSFKTLLIAFPALLAVIYILLALQFRSLLQPVLIFMAIPFSIFGIALGLYITDNPFSFFAMLGFFALIGLSIKNTILLTDYANQAKKEGMGTVDAVHEALAERFRPLIATSLTAVVSLIPLAITSPFWEGLSVVLIFGLLSSTFLVITVFPYYYLLAEFTRKSTSRGVRKLYRKVRRV